MEEEEKGISIGEIFKVIFKRVWWVVGITAAALIIFTCVMQFWFNPSEQKYTVSFDIRLPSENAYPDGTVLRLEDSVLPENLQLIKDEELLPEANRTGKFLDVDINKMINEDDIELIRTIEAQEDETYQYHYTLRITKKYFKDKDQAVDFVKAVAEFPVVKAKKIVNSMNYSERLSRYDRFLTYEEKISALIEQKGYILNTYEDIKNLYSGEYVPAGLDTVNDIDSYIRDLTDVFDAREQEAVRNTVAANYYVYDTKTYLEHAQANIDSRLIEIENNTNRIVELREERNKLNENFGSIQETTEFDKIIADLTDKNAVMRNEIKEIEITLTKINLYTEGEGKEAKEAFDARLDGIRDQLEQATQIMRRVNIATYEEKSQVIYVNNKVVVEGGTNIILAAIIGAVVGFVVVSIVILIIDLPRYKRQKLAAETGEEEIKEEADGEEKE